jgi:hypothetical protein
VRAVNDGVAAQSAQPFALTILGPAHINILYFHISLLHAGLTLALVATFLWFILLTTTVAPSSPFSNIVPTSANY